MIFFFFFPVESCYENHNGLYIYHDQGFAGLHFREASGHVAYRNTCPVKVQWPQYAFRVYAFMYMCFRVAYVIIHRLLDLT